MPRIWVNVIKRSNTNWKVSSDRWLELQLKMWYVIYACAEVPEAVAVPSYIALQISDRICFGWHQGQREGREICRNHFRIQHELSVLTHERV